MFPILFLLHWLFPLGLLWAHLCQFLKCMIFLRCHHRHLLISFYMFLGFHHFHGRQSSTVVKNIGYWIILPWSEPWGLPLLLGDPLIHSSQNHFVGDKFDQVGSIFITYGWFLTATVIFPYLSQWGQTRFGIQSFSEFRKVMEWVSYILYNTPGSDWDNNP